MSRPGAAPAPSLAARQSPPAASQLSLAELARRHAGAAVAEGAAHGRGADEVARALLGAVVEIYRGARGAEDVRRELEFVAEHVDGDDDFPFMRP